MAVYDQPTIINFAALESKWKIGGVSFIQTRRTSDAGTKPRSSVRRIFIGTSAVTGLPVINERRRSAESHQP